jgi:hypothetical protein
MHLVPALVAFGTQELPQPSDRRRVDRSMRLKTVGSGVVLAAMAAAGVPAQSQRIAAEITRLRAAAPEILPEGSRTAIVARLDRARAALADGRTYLALYDLQTAFEAEAGYRLASEQAYPDYDAFTRKWMDVGAPADPPSQKADVLFHRSAGTERGSPRPRDLPRESPVRERRWTVGGPLLPRRVARDDPVRSPVPFPGALLDRPKARAQFDRASPRRP